MTSKQTEFLQDEEEEFHAIEQSTDAVEQYYRLYKLEKNIEDQITRGDYNPLFRPTLYAGIIGSVIVAAVAAPTTGLALFAATLAVGVVKEAIAHRPSMRALKGLLDDISKLQGRVEDKLVWPKEWTIELVDKKRIPSPYLPIALESCPPLSLAFQNAVQSKAPILLKDISPELEKYVKTLTKNP